jgi:hypothetical protein
MSYYIERSKLTELEQTWLLSKMRNCEVDTLPNEFNVYITDDLITFENCGTLSNLDGYIFYYIKPILKSIASLHMVYRSNANIFKLK